MTQDANDAVVWNVDGNTHVQTLNGNTKLAFPPNMASMKVAANGQECAVKGHDLEDFEAFKVYMHIKGQVLGAQGEALKRVVDLSKTNSSAAAEAAKGFTDPSADQKIIISLSNANLGYLCPSLNLATVGEGQARQH